MSIGRNIYELRKARGWTQSQLSEKLDISEQAVSKWENDICAPDVSLFPSLATLFGVSIDRIYGFHLDSYDAEVDRILAESEASMDTEREIAILSEGLRRYPNSVRLKTALAFSYSMRHRMAAREEERREAAQRALTLCQEVVAGSGDKKQTDSALITMSRIYTEDGQFDAALEAIERMSADNYYGRIAYTASTMASRQDTAAQLRFVEESLFYCQLAMRHSVEGLIYSLLHTKQDIERARLFQGLLVRLLELFDGNNASEPWPLWAAAKMQAHELGATIHMKRGDMAACLDELEAFFALAASARAIAAHAVAHADDANCLHLSCRNSYFADTTAPELLEEFMAEVHPERVLPKYATFLAGEARFEQLV